VAADAEKHLTRSVNSSTAIMGPEFEFYVFDKVNFFQAPSMRSITSTRRKQCGVPAR